MQKVGSDQTVNRPRQADADKWLIENHAALQAYNDWVAKNGLPLEKYRQF